MKPFGGSGLGGMDGAISLANTVRSVHLAQKQCVRCKGFHQGLLEGGGGVGERDEERGGEGSERIGMEMDILSYPHAP
jgi:hypothetical protein